MERDTLEQCLAEGLSLQAIGQRVGKHPTTVSYWLRKHELAAVHSRRCAPRGGLTHEALTRLIHDGETIASMATKVERSVSTVQYWLRRHGLKTQRHRGRHQIPEDRPDRTPLHCRRHGWTEFAKRPDGGYRCIKCRSERVAAQRRRVKLALIAEAGGRCRLCGYDRFPGALHFHHLDPRSKAFSLSREGVYRSIARARAEAEKCALLCANCHAEVEGGFAVLPVAAGTDPG